MKTKLSLPPRNLLTGHIHSSLKAYWPVNPDILLSLPIPNNQSNDLEISLPLQLSEIALPLWATDFGVNGQLLVPKECLKSKSNENNWRNVDWWLAVFLLLEGWHERLWENTKGEIHSYSFRLKGWDSRVWDHAWVNRIALFIRNWLAREKGITEDSLPCSKLLLTHDVDAVSKSNSIRIKQGTFNLFNAIKLSSRGKLTEASRTCRKAWKILFGKEDWNAFEKLLKMEADAEICGVFNFYSDKRKKTFKRWLFDPSYDISTKEIKSLLAKILSAGHEIGLHPSFDSWFDSDLIANQRNTLEKYSGVTISYCRQHWLRFSWENTWAAQSEAGIQFDSTLMFNDRPGFRNSACLSWHPWDQKKSKAHSLASISSVLMDSHLYDYKYFTEAERKAEIIRWTKECKTVLGQCCLLWHPHTLNEEYGWKDGLKYLMDEITKTSIALR